MDGGTDEFCGFIGALERQPKIGTTTEERDDLGHTYWSGIYMSVTLVLAYCTAIVVTAVGVKYVGLEFGRELGNRTECN